MWAFAPVGTIGVLSLIPGLLLCLSVQRFSCVDQGGFWKKKACLNFLEIQLSFRCPIFKVHHLQILASSIQVKSTHLVKANCSFCLNKLWISVQSVLLHGHWYMIHCLVTLSRTKRHLITDDETEGLQGFSEQVILGPRGEVYKYRIVQLWNILELSFQQWNRGQVGYFPCYQPIVKVKKEKTLHL